MTKCSGHPNIVQLHEVIEDESKVSLVMEYCSGGNLMIPQVDHDEYLPTDQNDIADSGYFSDERARAVLKDVSNGLKFLHDNGIIHGEITPKNILIDAAGTAKIIGLDRKGDIKSRLGSIIAPEIMKMYHKRKASAVPGSQKSDAYQLGSLISTMLYGRAETLRNKYKGNIAIDKSLNSPDDIETQSDQESK